MRRPLFLSALITAVLASAVCPASACAADEVQADRQLPPDVLFYLSVPSVERLKQQFEKTAMGQLRDDERLDEFWEDVEAQLEQASAKIEQEVGLTLDEILAIPTGEVAFAVTAEPGRDPAAVLLMDFGRNEDAVDQLLDKAQQALEDNTEAERAVEEFEGTRIVVYSFPAPKGPDGEPAQQAIPGFHPDLAYCIKDTTLLVGTGADALKDVLARWDGKHPKVFADNEIYQYILRRCGTEGRTALMQWYINPVGALQAGLRAAARENPQFALAEGILPILGITTVRGAGGVVDMATGEFDTLSRTVLYVDQPPSGLLNLFVFPATDQSPPGWVSADVSAYQVVNWDADAAYKAVESLADNFYFRRQGGLADTLDELAESEDGPKVHLKKDIIDQLSGPIYNITYPPREEQGRAEAADNLDPSPFGTMPPTLFAFELKDQATVENAVKRAVAQAGEQIKSREFQGHTIYDLDIPQGQPAAAQLPSVFTVAKGFLMVSADTRTVEQALRQRQGNPLAELPAYRRVAEHFPQKTSMRGFTRTDSNLEMIYEALRSGQAGGAEPADDEIGEGEEELQIDFTKLPPFSVIREYLPAGGSYAVPDENGALFVEFTLPVEKKK